MNCAVCGNQLNSPRAKICGEKTCKSSWKIQRNSRLPLVVKSCHWCNTDFSTIDRRTNFCSSKCKVNRSNETKIAKYGSLRLESSESIRKRIEKLKKAKTTCAVQNCGMMARTKGFCAPHYVSESYLKTESGREIYRLHCQKRRHKDRETGTLLKSELEYIRKVQQECAKCRSTVNLTIDHHVPLSKNGSLSLTNVVLLCGSCNSKKHGKLPSEFYTIEELSRIEELLKQVRVFKESLPKVYFLFGCFGVGKSWVASKLIDDYAVIEYDIHRNMSFDLIDEASRERTQVLYVSSVKVTPFINKYGMTYNVVPVALIEPLDTICERLQLRGGKITDNVRRRFERIKVIASKYAAFTGNTEEVLDFLKQQANSL